MPQNMKEKKTPLDIVITPLVSSLRFSGCHPYYTTFPLRIWHLFLLVSNAFWLSLSLVHISRVQVLEDQIRTFINIIALSQICTVLILCQVNKKTLTLILTSMQQKFWFDEVELDTKILDKHKFCYDVLNKIKKLLLMCWQIFALGWIWNPFTYMSNQFALDMTFPYRNFIKEEPFFQIIFLLQNITVCIGGIFTSSCVDSLFYLIVGFVLVQIDLIEEKLKLLSADNIEETEIQNKLQICVVHHNTLLEILNDIDSIYKFTLLLKMGCKSVILCCAGYLFILRCDFYLIWLIMFFVTILQILMYFGFGDMLTSKCSNIGDEVYNVQWEKFGNKSITYSLNMMIVRAQRPVFLSAGGMVTLSLPNYVAFLKMVYSLYVLLTTKNDTEAIA